MCLLSSKGTIYGMYMCTYMYVLVLMKLRWTMYESTCTNTCLVPCEGIALYVAYLASVLVVVWNEESGRSDLQPSGGDDVSQQCVSCLPTRPTTGIVYDYAQQCIHYKQHSSVATQ